MTFVRVQGGEFMMGSPDADPDAKEEEKPQHRIVISPFFIGATEVTQAQYRTVMWYNPSHFSSAGAGKELVAGHTTDNHPVENVSWIDAIRFCNALSKKDGLVHYYDEPGTGRSTHVGIPDPKGRGYRLPTEAEWEYACRAGSSTIFCYGDEASSLGDHDWYDENSGGQTHPVSQKPANAFGLFDMNGNVTEWCWDERVPAKFGPTSAAARVSRSGIRVGSRDATGAPG